ncbi:MAG: hypothetical protein SFU56_14235 [Capsulimonadales bacterium]|nr:hypothetical protein [Capsulimonadales bacterium]
MISNANDEVNTATKFGSESDGQATQPAEPWRKFPRNPNLTPEQQAELDRIDQALWALEQVIDNPEAMERARQAGEDTRERLIAIREALAFLEGSPTEQSVYGPDED